MKPLVLLFGLFLGAMLAAGCSAGVSKRAAGAPVLVARAFTTNMPVEIDPPPVGHMEAYSTVTIHSQIGGVISEVHFQEGQEVQSNALLFTIDPRPSQAALASAQANLARDRAQLENAQIQFDREQKLFAQKLVSQDDYDTSKASRDTLQDTVRADEAAVTNANLNLGFCSIRAPMDGVAGALQFYQGNVVKAPDDTLVTLNRIHPICVEFSVPEQYLPVIRREMRGKNLKVAASFDGMTGSPPQGELTFIDNSVDPSTGTIQLKATFANANGQLWPGQYVTVVLTLSVLTNVVVVPSPAVQTGQNGEYVYVVESNQTDAAVEERPVVVGITHDGETVVEKGLRAGERIVTDGQLRLTPGVAVSVKNANSSPRVP